MKKIFKYAGLTIVAALVMLTVITSIKFYQLSKSVKANYALLSEAAPVLTIDGQRFRDLNKNGKLDIYEDSTAALDDRVDDLLQQMNLEEKAGLLFITMIHMQHDGQPMDMPVFSTNLMEMAFSWMLPPTGEMIARKKMNSFNIISPYDAEILARFNNNIQKLAERTRLGIPVTFATDPRHGTQNNPGAAVFTPSFSQWPSPLGLAATRDTNLVREFGDIARREYRAAGITLALSPMADLATEPRWGRINGTFGEDAELAAAMTKAYILGFQGEHLDAQHVACMAKHFAGGGPQKDGEDPHFPYGKSQIYPGQNFAYHLIPFTKGAFAANTAAIMPYYGIPQKQTDENVAFAFNKQMIAGLLQDSLKFAGLVCTDWNIISKGSLGEPRAWGVEKLSPVQRVNKVLDAGCDMFGGEDCPELVVELAKSGQITETRLDVSVRKILRQKFILGLFDKPYVDETQAGEIAGNAAFRQQGEIAQAKSIVLLKNAELLPLAKGVKIYAEGLLDPTVLQPYGTLVEDPAAADVVLLRIKTPYEKRDQYFLEQFFHQGRLYFSKEELNRILNLIDGRKSIVVANLERPAILTAIDAQCDALLADFGASDAVLAKIIFGESAPAGKLPFELPSSWQAVQNQLEDVPYDSENPLFEYGFGLSF